MDIFKLTLPKPHFRTQRLFIKTDFCSHLRCFNNESTQIYNMSFLFGSKANKVTVSNNATALTTNFGLQQPTPSKLATFVAAADEKEVKNDHVYYKMNDQKTKRSIGKKRAFRQPQDKS